MPPALFTPYIVQWRLRQDGEPLRTPGSHLLPVRHAGRAAMLKIALDAEERRGGGLMRWWAGDGAARVYAADDTAVVLERAQGEGSLLEMALRGEDDAASRIACATVARLHAPRSSPLPRLAALQDWFASLWRAAQEHEGLFATAAATARGLLADPREPVALHGDVHHRNILDFGARGWLAIDPKGLWGERGFDYANLLCNPELATAILAERFDRQAAVIAEAAELPRERLLRWTLVQAGLSAAWFLEDGNRPGAEHDFAVARLALRALGEA